MNTVAYLEKQLTNINALLHEIAGDFNEQEWLSCAAPGQNRIGFIVWHIPRTQDNILHSWIRGIPELFHRPDWAHWEELRPYGMGAGISLDEANQVATKVFLSETLTYADAVHEEMLAWLRPLSDDDLDQVPDAATQLAQYSEYQTAGFRSEFAAMYGQPVWNLLMRPCIGHIHRHLGELQLAKDLLRSR